MMNIIVYDKYIFINTLIYFCARKSFEFTLRVADYYSALILYYQNLMLDAKDGGSPECDHILLILRHVA